MKQQGPVDIAHPRNAHLERSHVPSTSRILPEKWNHISTWLALLGSDFQYRNRNHFWNSTYQNSAPIEIHSPQMSGLVSWTGSNAAGH